MLAPRKKLWSTPAEAVELTLDKLDLSPDDVVFDIGCGDARFLIECCRRSEARCVGIEIDEDRCGHAREQVKSAEFDDRISIRQENGLECSIDEATVLFLYLTPRGLRLILPKIQALGHSVRIVTYMAPLPELEADFIAHASPAHQPGARWPLYFYST